MIISHDFTSEKNQNFKNVSYVPVVSFFSYYLEQTKWKIWIQWHIFDDIMKSFDMLYLEPQKLGTYATKLILDETNQTFSCIGKLKQKLGKDGQNKIKNIITFQKSFFQLETIFDTIF